MITIADDLQESRRCITIAQEHADVFCTIGVHPHRAGKWCTSTCSGEKKETMEELLRASSKIVAIGEIGLDYHNQSTTRAAQHATFREQLGLAKEQNLPAVVHCREAVDDVWTIVAEVQPPRVVLHCCTESWESVERFVTRGDFLSFTGIATYPHADIVRDTIRRCPLDRMMVETDAPYLPPAALRAKEGRTVRNEPAFVVDVAKVIAQVKEIPFAAVDAATTANAVAFFGLPMPS